MGASVVDATPFGEIWVARTDGKIACARGVAAARRVSAWPAPRPPDEPARLPDVRALRPPARRRVPAARRARQGAPRDRGAALLPRHPRHRSRCTSATGAGSAPRCNRCSIAATPKALTAYLETQKEENLAYYARHAFELIEKIDVEGVPPVWTLSRKPGYRAVSSGSRRRRRRTSAAGAGCAPRRRRRSTARTPRRSSRRCPSSRAARGRARTSTIKGRVASTMFRRGRTRPLR